MRHVFISFFLSTNKDHSLELTFLTPDTYTNVCESGGKKFNFSENFACVINESTLSEYGGANLLFMIPEHKHHDILISYSILTQVTLVHPVF